MLTEQDQAVLRSYPEGAIETVRQTKDFGVPTYLAVTTGGATRMLATACGATDGTKKTVQDFTALGLLILKSVVDPKPAPKAAPPRGTARRPSNRVR